MSPARAARNIRIVGLKEVQEKLDADVLLQPEFNDALETFTKRFMRKRKNLGAKRNTLSSEITDLSVYVETTLNWPRTTGESWGKKNWAIANGMASRVMKKMIKRIQERWAEGS